MMLFDFNFAIILNLTLFVIFDGFREFCILCTKRSHKITISVALDCNDRIVYILCHILPFAPSES